MSDLDHSTKEFHKSILFCSRSLILFNLFTRGLKLVGSRRNVISREAKKRFIPERRDCGLYAALSVNGFKYHTTYLRCCRCCDGGLALKDDNAVSEVSCHDEVMFNDERGLLGVEDESAGGSENRSGLRNLIAHRLITLLAIMRCSESRKLKWIVSAKIARECPG